MLRLVGLAGEAQSGKSSMANFLEERLDFYQYGIADPIKDLMCALFGWNERHREDSLKETVCDVGPNPQAFFEKWRELDMDDMLVEMTRKEYVKMIGLLFQDETANDGPFISPRRAFQLFGTEYARAIRPTVWLDMAERELDGSIAEESGLIIKDVRFPNEHEWIVKSGGVVVHVRRKGEAHKIKEDTHKSEAGLKYMAMDWVTPECENLEQLEAHAEKLSQFVKNATTSDVAVNSRMPTFADIYAEEIENG